MNRATELLNLAGKKDDSARLIMSGDELFIETTGGLPNSLGDEMITVTIPNPTDEGLLEAAAVATRPDIRIQTIYNMFVAHSIATLTCLVLALPLYYFQPAKMPTIILLSTCCGLQTVFYFAMIYASKRHTNAAFGFYVAWTLASTIVVSAVAILLANVAPFQLLAMIWAQTVVIVVYTKLSPRMIKTEYALIFMVAITFVVWAISIAAFVIEHDWLSGSVILILGLATSVYHAFQIRISEAHGYNVSWEDTVLSIVQFYGDPVLLLAHKFCPN